MNRKVLLAICIGILMLGTFSCQGTLPTQTKTPEVAENKDKPPISTFTGIPARTPVPARAPAKTITEIPTSTPVPTSIPAPEPLITNIADSNREIIREALSKFDPKIREYLVSLPIIYGDARTAEARYVPQKKGREHIVVSYDWDNTHGESRYWESHFKTRGENENDPVFSRNFKLRLLVHEYLHHAELKVEIDAEKFFGDVNDWYRDPHWGYPNIYNWSSSLYWDYPDVAHSENYLKYVLFWNLYRGNGSKGGHSYSGQGEFAYIGTAIVLDGIARLKELPTNIIKYYRGILRKDLLIIPVLSE